MQKVDINKMKNFADHILFESWQKTSKNTSISSQIFKKCVNILKKDKIQSIYYTLKKSNSENYIFEVDKNKIRLLEQNAMSSHEIICDLKQEKIIFDGTIQDMNFANKLSKKLKKISLDMKTGKGNLKLIKEKKGI